VNDAVPDPVHEVKTAVIRDHPSANPGTAMKHAQLLRTVAAAAALSAPVRAQNPRVVSVAKSPIHDYMEPALAIDPTNPLHVFMAYMGFPTQSRARARGSGSEADRVAVSMDGGRTWQETPFPGAYGINTADFAVAIGADGTAYLAYLLAQGHWEARPSRPFSGMHVRRSRDLLAASRVCTCWPSPLGLHRGDGSRRRSAGPSATPSITAPIGP